MKFYDKQGSYSYYDSTHIKSLLTCIKHAFQETCGGWSSPAKYIYDNKKEYDITKQYTDNGTEYLTIYYRYLNSLEKQKPLHALMFSVRLTDEWNFYKAYKIKIGFYSVRSKIPDS